MNGIYKVDEVAEMLHVVPETVRRWLQQGKLKGFKAGWGWRVKKEELDAFIQGVTAK